jgi:hypothetical protein
LLSHVIWLLGYWTVGQELRSSQRSAFPIDLIGCKMDGARRKQTLLHDPTTVVQIWAFNVVLPSMGFVANKIAMFSIFPRSLDSVLDNSYHNSGHRHSLKRLSLQMSRKNLHRCSTYDQLHVPSRRQSSGRYIVNRSRYTRSLGTSITGSLH